MVGFVFIPPSAGKLRQHDDANAFALWQFA
jgi:hypothetical protein